MATQQQPPGHWLKVLIDSYCDGSDFNDGDDVLGWLSAKLTPVGGAPQSYRLDVTYSPDPDSSPYEAHTETYFVTGAA